MTTESAAATMTTAMRLLTALLLSLSPVVQGLLTPSHVLRRQKVSNTARGFNNFFQKPEPKKEQAPPEPEFVDGAYDEDDPIEKIFGFFFGKREEAPLGLCK